MPVVLLANVYITPQQDDRLPAEVFVSATSWASVFRELAARFPNAANRLIEADGTPRGWYALFRDATDEDLAYTPDVVLGEDERLTLMYVIGD